MRFHFSAVDADVLALCVWEKGLRLECHLAQVHVAVGRLAVAVHPQGQHQRQGEDAEREQGVHQHVQHGRDSRGRPDFHCRRETLAASRRYDMTDASISMHFITCCNCFMTSCVYAVTKCVQQGAVLSPNVYHCGFFSQSLQ